MSGRLNGASFLFDEFDGTDRKAVCIRMFWRRPGAASPLDSVNESIAVAHSKARLAKVVLSPQPTRTTLQEVRLEPGKGIIVVADGATSDYYMLTMEFEVLERLDG